MVEHKIIISRGVGIQFQSESLPLEACQYILDQHKIGTTRAFFQNCLIIQPNLGLLQVAKLQVMGWRAVVEDGSCKTLLERIPTRAVDILVA